MVNDGEVFGGERIKGANCSTGGCAVAVYARRSIVRRPARFGSASALGAVLKEDA